MLILIRKNNEGFRIGTDIYVTVLQVQSGRVKLGIRAPHGVSVLREELLDPAEDDLRAPV
jgi:carbon storage regulator